CRLAAGLRLLCGFCSDPHGPALRLIEVEGSSLPDQIAELSIAVCPRVEVGGDVREALPNHPQANPAILRLHLRNRPVQDGNGRARRLESLWGWPLFGSRNLRLGQQVLSVNEPAAGLPKALGGLLLTETIDVGALFPQTRCKPRKVAV